MFYLIKFFETLIKEKVVGVFFILLTCFIFFVTIFNNVQNVNQFYNAGKSKNTYPYFNMAIEKELMVKIENSRISKLPGIVRLERKVSKSLPIKLDRNIIDVEEFGILRIYLEPNIDKESFNLIKQYITKFLKIDFLTFSKLYHPKGIADIEKARPFLFVSLAVLYFLWLIFFWVILTRTGATFFIMEHFQRKSLVRLKSFAIGLLFCLLLSVSLVKVFNFSLTKVDLGIMLGMLFIPLLLTFKFDQLVEK